MKLPEISTAASNPKDPFIYILKMSGLFIVLTALLLFSVRASILFGVLGTTTHNASELYAMFLTGLRFDLKVGSALLLLLVFIPTLICALINRWTLLRLIQKPLLALLLLTIVILSFVDIGFYFYFGTQISNLIFGLVNDGTYEVLISIFADWRLVLINICALLTSIIFLWLFNKLLSVKGIASRSGISKWKILSITFLLTFGSALLARGSLDTFPLSRKTSVVSDNSIINSLALNAPFHFYYTYKDRKKDNFTGLTKDALLAEAHLTSIDELVAAAGYSTTNPIKKKTALKDGSFKSPNVIFVLMEGWSSHIALQDAQDNQVLGEFSQHAKNDYFFTRFFSNKYGTNPTIESLLLNSPISPITQSSANQHRFSLSNVLPFKQSGYETLFLSGGNSSWRKHNQFWPKQGFDRYIGRATIEQYFDAKSDNPWGVYDGQLFKFLEQQLTTKTDSSPLFSFVLTTNNHGPIRLPADYQPPALNPGKYGFAPDNTKKHESLTGFHYQSDALGKFMTWLKSSKFAENTIVVATGDHVLKGFANYTAEDDIYNRFSVPAYFYIPPKYDQLQGVSTLHPGSHQDLFPTLYELSLNQAEYYSFGQALNSKTPETSYGAIDQGGFIFNEGASDQQHNYLPWKGTSNRLLPQWKPMTQQQLALIKQQRYKEILQKYLLMADFKPAEK